MNLTNIDHPTSTWKDVKTKSVIAAAGVALIASAVVSAARWQESSKPVTNVAHASSRNAPYTVPMQVYHIVATEAERDMLATEFGGNYIVKGSDREALFHSDQVEAMTRAIVDFRVIDATKPNFGQISSAGPATIPEITASVLSLKHGTTSRSTEQQVLVPDDYAGGVRAPRNLRERLQAQRGDFNASPKGTYNDYSARPTQPDLITSAASMQSQSGAFADAGPTVHSLEADIMASVVSTENAAYGLSATRAKKREASDSDIAASALSGELAAFGDTGPVAQSRASESEIVSSVLGAEFASYDFDAPVAIPSLFDILASVISTERAAWPQ